MSEREPTPDELAAMAYVDGELEAAARREFENRMATSAYLRREVADLQKLHVIARQVAGPEPMDYEWEALDRDILHRGAMGLGFSALLVAVVGLAGWGVLEVVRSDLETVPKVLLVVGVAGFLALFGATLRARLRTLPYDPYVEVQR